VQKVSVRGFSRKLLGLLPPFPERIILMLAKLWVGNLSPETTSEEIRPKGFAFIEMNSLEAAYKAKEKFNGHELHGKPLKVKGAQPKNV
jgi:RNA recognition motif-containing protein